ncbi:MAG: NfeD family protein [bacterium]
MRTKILVLTFSFIFLFLSVLFFTQNSAQNDKVFIIPIKDTIELGLSGIVKRAINEAKGAQAKAIILEIDTYGGRVDAADEICGSLASAEPIPTIAFVTEEAWSAGAMISLGCKEIFMAPGSSIGAAEPRVGMGGEETADEKSVSAIRAKFRSLASKNGYPEDIAQGMVDKDLEIKTIKPKGKLITLSADEAIELKLAKKIVKNRGELLALKNLDKCEIVEISPTWSENLVRFLTGPIVSSLLITLGFLGIIYELMYPGWGVSGTAALFCLSLFFWGHYLIGMAEWFEILLLVAGVGLLGLEIFVIPSFGMTGISGITLIVISIFLSMVKHPNPLEAPKMELWNAFYILSWSVIIVFIGFIAGIKFLPKTKLWEKIILSSVEKKSEASSVSQSYLGKTGKTASILRPSGRAVFDDKILDVLSEGEFIDKDTTVKVVKIDGSKVVVRMEN